MGLVSLPNRRASMTCLRKYHTLFAAEFQFKVTTGTVSTRWPHILFTSARISQCKSGKSHPVIPEFIAILFPYFLVFKYWLFCFSLLVTEPAKSLLVLQGARVPKHDF
jgi:hypothetical protein